MPLDVDYIAGKQAIDELDDILSNTRHGEREKIADKIIELVNNFKKIMQKSYLSDRLAIDRLKKEYLEHKNLIIGFDFDSTIFDYHEEELELQSVIDLLKKCSNLGFTMCIWSLCSVDAEMNLEDKVKYCNRLGIAVDYYNQSPILSADTQKASQNYKPYFNILLDDRAGLSASYNILLTTLKELELWN